MGGTTQAMDASNGITTEMRELAAAATLPPAGRQLVTAIITANLRFSGNPHRRGTFMQQGNNTLMGSVYALVSNRAKAAPLYTP